jgi:hypothetical protein
MGKPDLTTQRNAEHFANLFSALEPRDVMWIVEAARKSTVAELEALELELVRLRAGFEPIAPAAVADWFSVQHASELEHQRVGALKRLATIDALIRLLDDTSAKAFAQRVAEAFKGRV